MSNLLTVYNKTMKEDIKEENILNVNDQKSAKNQTAGGVECEKMKERSKLT